MDCEEIEWWSWPWQIWHPLQERSRWMKAILEPEGSEEKEDVEPVERLRFLPSYALSILSGPSLHEKFGGGRRFIYVDRVMGQRIVSISNTSYNVAFQIGGIVCYDGIGSTIWTLPGLASGMEGVEYTIVNASTAGTLTVNTAVAGDLFNRQTGKVSYSLAPGQFLRCHAVLSTTGATLYWAVVGTNGT